MVESLIVPSYKQGFARGSLSLRPNLWRGLVGCWKMSLGCSGINTLFDVSGYGNHGTMIGGMTIDDWVISNNPRIPGYVLDFDGAGDGITVASSASLDSATGAGQPRSWGYWCKFRASDNKLITDKQNFIGVSLWSEKQDSGGSFSIDGGVTTSNALSTGFILSFDIWYFVMFTYDGTATRLYIDAVLSDGPNTQTAPADSDNAFNIMGAIELPSYTASGQMNMVVVYNRALSSAEIWDMYQYPNAMFQFRDRAIGRVAVVVAGTTILTLPVKNYMRNLITR